MTIADGARAGNSAREIAAGMGRAVSTVSRELQRNLSLDGEYRPHAAQAMMRARRPRPKCRLLERDCGLRDLVQRYLDQRWSPEQVVHELAAVHGRRVAVETIYQGARQPAAGCSVIPEMCYALVGHIDVLVAAAINAVLGSWCRSP